MLVNGQAAVGIAVVGKTAVQALSAHKLLQGLDVRGTHAGVDVGAVGLTADGVDLRAHGLEHAARNGPGSAVGTVQADALATQGEDALRDEEAHVAVAAGEVILDRAHLGARGPRKLRALEAQAVDLAVEVGLDECDEVVAGLLAVAVHELDAVVVVRVVRGAHHDAAVKILGAGDIGNAGRRGDVHGICVATAGSDTAGQGILKHVAGTTRVLADDDARAARFVITRVQLAGQALELAVVPAQETADLKGVLSREAHARFAAETVGAEILSHKEPVLRNVERTGRICLRQASGGNSSTSGNMSAHSGTNGISAGGACRILRRSRHVWTAMPLWPSPVVHLGALKDGEVAHVVVDEALRLHARKLGRQGAAVDAQVCRHLLAVDGDVKRRGAVPGGLKR